MSTKESYNFIDNVFPFSNPFSGNVGFTGPDGLRDYRPHLVTSHDQRAVGHTGHSTEHSGDVEYLFRCAPGAPAPRPRSAMPGEIGWGVPELTDWATPTTGQQIMLGSFRQIAEDRSTHEHMGCWYAHPATDTPPGSDGYYRENIYSGRPGTSNVRTRAHSPWRPASRAPRSGGQGSRSGGQGSRSGGQVQSQGQSGETDVLVVS